MRHRTVTVRRLTRTKSLNVQDNDDRESMGLRHCIPTWAGPRLVLLVSYELREISARDIQEFLVTKTLLVFDFLSVLPA